MIKSIKNFHIAQFLQLFAHIQQFINDGLKLADSYKFIFNQLPVVMGKRFSTLVFNDDERSQIMNAFELYNKDGRAHVWIQPLKGLIHFEPRVVWNEDEYTTIFKSMAVMLEKDGRIKAGDMAGEVIMSDSYVFAAVATLPVIHQKDIKSGSSTMKVKSAFCIWYLNRSSDAWRTAVGLGYKTVGDRAIWKERAEKVAKNPPPELKQVSKFTEQKTPVRESKKSKATPAPVEPKPVGQTELALGPVTPQQTTTHKADRDLPEQIGAALHYLEKALERTFTTQLSNLVSAIRAPQQVAVFPVINQITYKMPKTRGIPMTKMFLPTVRVEVPVKVQSAIPETLLRELVRKQVEEMLGESSSQKQPCKTITPLDQTPSVKQQESVVKDIPAPDTTVKSFQELGLVLGKQVAAPALETTGRKLSVVILGMRASNLPSVIKGLPTYVTVEAFFELNARAKNRVKHVDYIYVMKYGAAESLDFLKKNSIRHFSNMGESGGGMIRSGILELIDRRGWIDECTVDKIGARS